MSAPLRTSASSLESSRCATCWCNSLAPGGGFSRTAASFDASVRAREERRQRMPDRGPGHALRAGLETKALFFADEEHLDVGGGVGQIADSDAVGRAEPTTGHLRRDHVIDIGVRLDRQRRGRGGDRLAQRARDRGDREPPLTRFRLRTTRRVQHDLRVDLEVLVSQRQEVDVLRRDRVPAWFLLVCLIGRTAKHDAERVFVDDLALVAHMRDQHRPVAGRHGDPRAGLTGTIVLGRAHGQDPRRRCRRQRLSRRLVDGRRWGAVPHERVGHAFTSTSARSRDCSGGW